MNLHCLQCGKPVPQTPGKRAKSYCNNTCRVTYWKKQKEAISGIKKRKPGRPPRITKEINAEEIQAQIKEVKASLAGKPILKGVNTEKDDRKIVNPEADKTRQMKEPEEGTNAFFMRYGTLYKKDIPK